MEMNNKPVTVEQLAKLNDINDALAGTRIYNRYYMYHSSKNEKGRWLDLSWSNHVRVCDGAFIKIVKGATYLMIPDSHFVGEYDRYEITSAVAELFGWEV